MEDFGLVSIVTPMFNDEKYISRTISSVINQTYRNWELIIVDDHSIDNSVTIVNSFDDKRIKLLISTKNEGTASARNKALATAKGKWIAFLDGDDRWLPEKLYDQLSFMTTNGFKFSCTAYYDVVDETKIAINTAPKVISKNKMFSCDYLGCLTAMYSAETMGLIQVDGRIKKRNDYAIFLDASRNASCYFLNKPLALYTIRKNSVSHVSKLSLLKSHFYLFRYQENFSFLKSWLFAIRNAVIFVFYKKRVYKHRLRY